MTGRKQQRQEKVLPHLFGIICDIQEEEEVGISTKLAHDLHDTDALPQAAGWLCTCICRHLSKPVMLSQQDQNSS